MSSLQYSHEKFCGASLIGYSYRKGMRHLGVDHLIFDGGVAGFLGC